MIYEAIMVIKYLRTYGVLPPYYITKSVARQNGWHGGSVERLLPRRAIGGDLYYNRNHALPYGTYRECDLGDTSQDRGANRLVYSDDGRFYLTADHYENFTEIL